MEEIRARTRIQFVNPVLADALRRHAALFQYAGIEPDFSPDSCFFTVRDDLFPMPRQLSDVAPCLLRFLAGYNDRDAVASLRRLLQADALTAAYRAVSIDQRAALSGSQAARFNTRPASYAPAYYAAILRRIAARNDWALEAVTPDRFVRAVRHIPAHVTAAFAFDGQRSTYLRAYRLENFQTDADPLVVRVDVLYDEHNQPRQARTYDARERPQAPRSARIDFARTVSPRPDALTFAGKTFVLTGGDKEALTRAITARGGTVRPSLVRCADYLIIGDQTARETAKIAAARARNAQSAGRITALWEHEFWRLCAGNDLDRPGRT